MPEALPIQTQPLVAELRDVLDKLDAADAEIQTIRWPSDPAWRCIILADCDSYRRACQAYRKTPDAGRLIARGIAMHRVLDCDLGPFVAQHVCWPHLTCWGS